MKLVWLAGTFPLALWLSAGCGGPTERDARYPTRPAGCEVQIFRGPVPAAIKYERIGGVDAICAKDLNDEKCMRVLKDQACALGADIVYDLPAEPATPTPDKVRWVGRAAHTRLLPKTAH